MVPQTPHPHLLTFSPPGPVQVGGGGEQPVSCPPHQGQAVDVLEPLLFVSCVGDSLGG